MVFLFHDLHYVCKKIGLSYAIVKLLVFFDDINVLLMYSTFGDIFMLYMYIEIFEQ